MTPEVLWIHEGPAGKLTELTLSPLITHSYTSSLSHLLHQGRLSFSHVPFLSFVPNGQKPSPNWSFFSSSSFYVSFPLRPAAMLGGCLRLVPQGPGQRAAYHSGDPSTSTSPHPYLLQTRSWGQALKACLLDRGEAPFPLFPSPCVPSGGLRLGGLLSDQAGWPSVHPSTWVARASVLFSWVCR